MASADQLMQVQNNTYRHKVFLTGGDGVGWALDGDLHIVREALSERIDEVPLNSAEIVHSVWWEPLLEIPPAELAGKRIICQVAGEPFRYLSLPGFHRALNIVGCWITQSVQAHREMALLGIPSTLVPYAVDVGVFRPLPKDSAEISDLRKRLDIPSDHYLVGSFQRDSEGRDLHTPKLVKGPDVFLEVVTALHRRDNRIHVILAGPRRHWLRSQLRSRQIPFTFAGNETEKDDIAINTLPHSRINALYNLVDAYLIASRSEGGPKSILEACAAGCGVASTRVGIAGDLLDPACIYSSGPEAVELLTRDRDSGFLHSLAGMHRERILKNHVVSAISGKLEQLYKNCDAIPLFYPSRTAERRSCRSKRLPGRFKVSLWHKFVPPPFGGGNQFMHALKKGLADKNVHVVENGIAGNIDAYVLNAIWFDMERFRRYRKNRRMRIVHRIDGLMILGRGRDRHLDDLCFDLNREMADATVMQSAWIYRQIVSMGYRPVNPTIIHNAVNPAIFHPLGRVPFDPGRKIRLISTSWSDNPRKGGRLYKWIDEHFDRTRFEYTFVGRCSETFRNIRVIPPVPSDQLADLLRAHDIYITAALNDACSNSLVEALSCGLPALYVNSGGHPELVGQGGLPFVTEDDILPQMDILVENYEMFRALINVPTLETVTERYLALLRGPTG